MIDQKIEYETLRLTFVINLLAFAFTQEILVHDWLNSSKVDSTSNILIATYTEPKQSYSPNIIDEPVETTTKVCSAY